MCHTLNVTDGKFKAVDLFYKRSNNVVISLEEKPNQYYITGLNKFFRMFTLSL